MNWITVVTVKPVICLAHRHLEFLRNDLHANYDVIRGWDTADRARFDDVEVLVVAGEVPLDKQVVEAMPRLGFIACASTGYDGIDLDWVRSRGLQLSRARHVNDGDVADHAMGCVIAHYRNLLRGGERVRSGQWPAPGALSNRSLAGLRLGILGLGDIGLAVAERAAAFRMNVEWWGPRPKEAALRRAPDLQSLAEASDVLVIAARADANNRGIVDRQIIEALGSNGLIVNVARGQLVDEQALIAALCSGRLGAAALDVFETEPTPPARWQDVPNLILTPHTAGRTEQAVLRIRDQLRGNVAAYFNGLPLITPLV